MTSITDPCVDEQLSCMLEESRNKIIQALGEIAETEEEFCQAHKRFCKSAKDACSCSKESETMFESIQIFRTEIEHIRDLTKQKRDLIPETLAEMEDKDTQKEKLIRNINQLKKGLDTKRELIVSQNKANKARLKNLNKAKLVFQESLGLEIRKIPGEKLQFIFRNVNVKHPETAYTFILKISEEGQYEVVSCDPQIESMPHLHRKLLETNNFSAFLANVRKEFASFTFVKK